RNGQRTSGVRRRASGEGSHPSSRPAGTAKGGSHTPVAIVGISAHFGPFAGKDVFRDRVLRGARGGPAAEPPANWWGVQESNWYRREAPEARSFPGHYLASLEFRVDQFRIPPKELIEMLPQQSLMLRVAAEAIRDAGWDSRQGLRTGVLIGIGLDLNTTN